MKQQEEPEDSIKDEEAQETAYEEDEKHRLCTRESSTEDESAAIAPDFKCNVLTIVMNKEEIGRRAYNLFLARRSYDEYIWLWAEAELRIAAAIITRLDANATEIKIDVTKILDHPDEAKIRALAREYAAKQLKAPEVHWFIAERQHIFAAAKAINDNQHSKIISEGTWSDVF